jgi:transposase-like protein
MLAPSVIDEMKTADLKDKRLDARLREVLSQLGSRPVVSIPAACGGHAETTAAYRFFDNEKVTFDKILHPHQTATRQRLAAQRVAILAQDTTELDLTRPGEQVEGAGPLDGSARYGVLLHLLAGFTPDGTPLGTLEAQAWVRDVEAVRTASLSRAERAATPLVQKESYRWIETLQQAQAILFGNKRSPKRSPKRCCLLKRSRSVAAKPRQVAKRVAAVSLGNRVRPRWKCVPRV